MPTKNITIRNQSGNFQSYALVADKPQVSGVDSSKVWSTVVQAHRCPPGGQAQFTIYDSYSVVLGTVNGGLSDGNTMSVSQSKPAGTGDSLSVSEEDGQLGFGAPQPPQGGQDIYVTTGGDVRSGDSVLALGTQDYRGNASPFYAFPIRPSSQYKLQLPSKFFVITGNYQTGSFVDIRNSGSKLEVYLQTDGRNVTAIHSESGHLIQQG